MTSKQPLISIIIAVYNGAETLERCLNSLRHQTFPDWELILMDGGSTDRTLDIVRTHEAQIRHWVSEPDNGIYDAWNKALPHARGEWVFFLGADDSIHDDHVLENMAPFLIQAPPDASIVYGKVAIVSETSDVLEISGKPWEEIQERFRQEMCICHQGVFHRRSLFDVMGPFDLTFRIAGDYELLLRALKHDDAVFVPDVVIARMQFGGTSSSVKGAKACLREFERARAKHGIPSSLRKQLISWGNAYARQLYVALRGPDSEQYYERLIRKLKPGRNSGNG